MNKVIRREMLAGDLPAELAKEFDPGERVSVVVSATSESAAHETGAGQFSRYRHLAKATYQDDRDVIRWVRSLRDEWD